jgi:hypothetical protein
LLENPFTKKTYLYKNELVKDPKMAVRRKTCGGSVQFNLGLLREGTVLKSNGFIMTDKGRMIDASLLDEDDPVRKKLEERQQRMEEE